MHVPDVQHGRCGAPFLDADQVRIRSAPCASLLACDWPMNGRPAASFFAVLGWVRYGSAAIAMAIFTRRAR